jgi:hypothetical protein
MALLQVFRKGGESIIHIGSIDRVRHVIRSQFKVGISNRNFVREFPYQITASMLLQYVLVKAFLYLRVGFNPDIVLTAHHLETLRDWCSAKLSREYFGEH